MLELGINGYTRQEVIDQLHGKKGSRGPVKIRYDLLNRQDVKLGELMVQSGRVAMNSLAEIKRTASFELTEQEARDVDWLNDRIRPVFCLKMPEIRKTYKAWGKIDASFSRSSIAYLSDGTQVAANQPRFEPGKFGKAVLVEEGTENLVPSLVAFTLRDHASRSLTVIDDNMVISTCIAEGDTAFAVKSPKVNVTEGEIYTFSFYAKANGLDGLDGRPTADDWRTKINWYDGNNTLIAWDTLTDTTLYEYWKRYIITAQAPTGAVKAEVIIGGDYPNFSYVGAKAYFKNIQLEAKPYATSFIDGTRAAETLTIPTEGVLNPQEGTVECWVYVNDVIKRVDGIPRRIFHLQRTAGIDIALALYHSTNSANWILNINDAQQVTASESLTPNGWNHFAVTFINGLAKLYINGVPAATITNAQLPIIGGDLWIGCRNDGTQQCNTLVDDLRISSRARSDAEILAAYQRNKPHLIDQWTTAKFSFDDKLSGDYFTLVVERDISAQWIEWPLGVFLLSSPTRKDENRQVRRSIEAYDSSLILKEDKFTDRYLIAAGTKYTDAVIDLLNGAGIWKINIIDHPGTLATDREFEIGTSKLFAVNELLAAINYTSLWVDENGYFVAQPYVLPSNRDPEYEYRTNDLSVIHPGSTEELDLFAVPNKWVRYVSNPDRIVILRSEYTNDLPTSPTSTINRGRTIVDIDHVEDIYDQATLDEYVKRIAYNASQVYGKFEFATALMPHHSYYNCLFVEYKDLNIAHKYMESSWSMDLQPGGAMTHSCRRVIII